MEPETYAITDAQWHEVNDALLAAIAICALHVPDMRDRMIKASIVMDDIVDASEPDEDDDGEDA